MKNDKAVKQTCNICGCTESIDNPIFNGICLKCMLEKNPELLSIPTRLDLKLCNLCNAIFIQGNWSNPLKSVHQAVIMYMNHVINYKVKAKEPLKIINVNVMNVKINSNRALVKLDLTIAYGNKITHQVREVTLHLKKSLCSTCFRRRAKVHEAIVQVRVSEPKALASLKDKVNKLLKKLSRDVVDDIVDIKEVREGIDLYFTSKETARYVASKFSHYYLAKVIETHKFMGRDRSGKRKSRITLSVRLPDIYVGDVVEAYGKLAVVKRMNGASIILELLDRGEEVKISHKDYWDKNVIKKVEDVKVKKAEVLVVKPNGKVKLLDLETFDVYDVDLGGLVDVKKGDVIKVLIHGGKVYVLR